MSPSRYADALKPADLHLLQRVFDRICRERGLSHGSAEAEIMAANLVLLWQTGQRDEDTLRRSAGKVLSAVASSTDGWLDG